MSDVESLLAMQRCDRKQSNIKDDIVIVTAFDSANTSPQSMNAFLLSPVICEFEFVVWE